VGVFSLNPLLISVANVWPHGPFDLSNPYIAGILNNQVGLLVWSTTELEGEFAWFFLHLFVLITSTLLLTFYGIKSLGLEQGLTFSALFSLSTISAVLFGWIGSYDAWTFLAMVLFLISWSRNWSIVFLATFFLTFQHYSQALFLIIIGVITAKTFRRELSSAQYLSIFLGWISGVLTVRLTAQSSDTRWSLLTSYESFLKWGLWKLEALPFIAYSILGSLIIILLWDGELKRLRGLPHFWRIPLALTIAAAPAVITHEPTRPWVYAIFLPTIWWLMDFVKHNQVSLVESSQRLIFWILILVPPIVSFDGYNLRVGARAFIDSLFVMRGWVPPFMDK
jgi:hypothetical protein